MAAARDTSYVRGAARLSQRISTISAALNLPVLTESVASLLLARTLRRFDQQVDPDGRPWEPHAESTKRQRGSNATILNRTGAMRGAITRIRGNAAGTVYAITGAGARIGIDDPRQVPKGTYHQYGTRHIPQRRFLGIGRLDVKAVDSLLRRKSIALTRGS